MQGQVLGTQLQVVGTQLQVLGTQLSLSSPPTTALDKTVTETLLPPVIWGNLREFKRVKIQLIYKYKQYFMYSWRTEL